MPSPLRAVLRSSAFEATAGGGGGRAASAPRVAVDAGTTAQMGAAELDALLDGLAADPPFQQLT
ncbi:hypothetical protein ABT008_28095 [Micromonospora sp. NPDC002389]|uniref:hypothetical protein n=1 Tax=Micromonospora sp. NPDC002389 TaxID=3154272 RepID=UPI003323DD0A